MTTFEQGFAEAERAANLVFDALARSTRQAQQLRKAAQDGNIAAMRRSTQQLQDCLNLVRHEVANAADAWPFAAEEEQAYLQNQYEDELIDEAEKKNLQIFERDGRLIAHPSIIRVMPGDRAVQINRRRTTTIRPTRIVSALEDLQRRPPRFRAQAFLESLYDAYVELSERSASDRLGLGEVGQVIRLDRIYRLFTGLPGAKRDYSQLDFARDLFNLESSDTRQTRSGARVSFPAATGTRGGAGTISFIGHNGETVPYYGIQFQGAS